MKKVIKIGIPLVLILFLVLWLLPESRVPDDVPVSTQTENQPTATATVSPIATGSPTSTKINSPTPKPSSGDLILQTVAFMAQAPSGNWADPRQQDGCEEASALMAMKWVKGVSSVSIAQAEKEILELSDWELEKYGSYRDTSTTDTVKRIFQGYFGYNGATAVKNISAEDIISELEEGNLVIVMANGRVLNNPYYTPPGPERHALVIIGYDPAKDQFITNDPGTRSGKGFRYSRNTLYSAIRDYPTGDHEPIVGTPKNMIVVRKI